MYTLVQLTSNMNVTFFHSLLFECNLFTRINQIFEKIDSQNSTDADGSQTYHYLFHRSCEWIYLRTTHKEAYKKYEKI